MQTFRKSAGPVEFFLFFFGVKGGSVNGTGDTGQHPDPPGHPVRETEPPDKKPGSFRWDGDPQMDVRRIGQAHDSPFDQEIGQCPVSAEFCQPEHLPGDPFIAKQPLNNIVVDVGPFIGAMTCLPLESCKTTDTQWSTGSHKGSA